MKYSWYAHRSSSVGSLCLLALWALVRVPEQAQAQPGETSVDAPVQLVASRIEQAIDLDGRLDEPAWQAAAAVSSFSQYEPLEGASPSQRTEVRILYDAGGLYVGAMLFDDEPGRIEASLGRRDDYNRADWFLVSIDSYFDRKSAYTFGVNAAGVQFDAHQTGGRGGLSFGAGYGAGGNAPEGMDPSWDAIWYSAHRVTRQGWAVEMRIPYSMLRFPDRTEHTWGIHFIRRIPRLGEHDELPLVPRTQRASMAANFGLLTGIRDISPKRNLQFSPYTVGKYQRQEDPAVSGTTSIDNDVDAGADLKVGLGSNVTLDVTFNPDFGQVESDAAVLNLTAFETRYPEKRPFFLEGMQIFQFDLARATMPYSRRIGATSPIIGAAKLSGRTAGGFSFGLISASTGDNLRPERHYEVARLMQQIGRYSSIGFMVTGFDAAGPDEIGRARSSFIGSDYDIRLGNNRYNIAGFLGVTRKWWTRGALDPNTGIGFKYLMSKRLGSLTGFLGVEGFDRHFDVNDVGQIVQNDYFQIPLRVSYQLYGGRPFGSFLRATVGDFAAQRWSVSDVLNQGQSHSFSFAGTLRGFQTVSFTVPITYMFGGYDIYETRGMGPWAAPRQTGVTSSFTTDARRDWSVGPSLSFSGQEGGGRLYGGGLKVNMNLGSRFIFNGSVEAEFEDDFLAWASNETFLKTDTGWSIGIDASQPDAVAPDRFVHVVDATALADIFAGVSPYGPNRYYAPVFGLRDTRALDLTLRNTTTFTKDLSLQIYTQLFLARGRYADFQILRDRDSLVPFEAFPKRAEFSLTSLQSNLVLRWEYRPGSVVYAVWTHGRRGNDVLNPLAPWHSAPFGRGIGDQIAQTFDIIPTNVFLVKVNYTLLN